MFVANARRGYTRDGSQWARGAFLIMTGPDDPMRWCQIGFCRRWPDVYDASRSERAMDTFRERVRLRQAGVSEAEWPAEYSAWLPRPRCEGPIPARRGGLAAWRLVLYFGMEPPAGGCVVFACDRCQRAVLHLNPTLGTWEQMNTRAPIRCFVRHVAMHQLGHFMMGTANLFGTKVLLSGSYGGDGLPRSVPREIWVRGLELPSELREAWNKGGGWNDAGSEALRVRQWALDNLARLRNQKERPKQAPRRKHPHCVICQNEGAHDLRDRPHVMEGQE